MQEQHRKNRDGETSDPDGEHGSAYQTTERSDRKRNESRQGKEESGESKERKFHLSKKTSIIGGTILVVVLLGAFLYWLHARNFESTDDAYTTSHVHEISSRVAGTVESVNVDDNQFVKRDQPLVLLDQRDFKVALEKARALVSQRRAAFSQAQANLDHAQRDYDRTTQLAQNKVVPKSDVDNVTAALKTASGAAAAAEADLAAAQASLSEAELQLSYTVIAAPVDGVIGKKAVETGAHIQPGQALMAVVERDVWVLANFKETQLPRMRVGQHVDVKIDAVPDRKFSAQVDSFQPGTGSTFALLPPDNATGNFTKIVQRVPVKIVFDDLDGYRDRIVPGLSCEPKVDLRTGKRK
jgi:membrane fusion protein (multidrug efflux system)